MPSTRSMVIKMKSYIPSHEDTLTSLLKGFMMSAWNAYDSSTMFMNDWARNQSRRFYYEVSKDLKFADVYNSLMSFGTSMMEEKEIAQSLKYDSALVGVIVKSAKMTDDEERLGRANMNSVLYREYSAWWDAFVQESNEDDDDDSPTASDRFSYHCARILGRKTGLNHDLIVPIVGAWLIEKADASV